MQGRSLERQDQKRKLISWIGVILLLTILLAEVLDTGIQMNVRQAMWRLWYGHQILWQGVRLELGEHYFVFPNHSEKALIVGRFGQNNEMFPDKDILMLK